MMHRGHERRGWMGGNGPYQSGGGGGPGDVGPNTSHGRVHDLIRWLVDHEAAINANGAESGQLWLTWKGTAISGEIKTKL